MIHLGPIKSKRGIGLKFKEYNHKLEHEVKELFIGHRTIFSLLGFAVSGILVG